MDVVVAPSTIFSMPSHQIRISISHHRSRFDRSHLVGRVAQLDRLINHHQRLGDSCLKLLFLESGFLPYFFQAIQGENMFILSHFRPYTLRLFHFTLRCRLQLVVVQRVAGFLESSLTLFCMNYAPKKSPSKTARWSQSPGSTHAEPIFLLVIASSWVVEARIKEISPISWSF